MVGASGAGKTSTLRDLATTCRSGWIEGDHRPVIPLYLDMARFAWLEPRGSLRDFVLSQIGHDTGFIRQVDEAWADTRINVTWLFLFDNADHPLMRWPSGEDSYSWVSEVIDFVNSNPARFRAVLACEEVPAIPGKNVELAPLNAKLRAEFLSRRGVTPAQQEALIHEKSFRQYVDNPGWLNMVSKYLSEHFDVGLNTFRDLMDGVLGQFLSSTQAEQLQYSGDLLEVIMEEIAFTLFKEGGSEILRTTLVDATCETESTGRADIEVLIDHLADKHLLKRYLKGGSEYIKFEAESVQAHYLTRKMLGGAADAFIEKLIADFAYTTVAISLLQFGDDSLVQKALECVRLYLRPPEPTPLASTIVINRMLSAVQVPVREGVIEEEAPSISSRDSYHFLYVLEAGLNRRTSLIPEDLREATDLLLAQTFAKATPRMLEQTLDFQHLPHEDVIAACCVSGLRSESGRVLTSAIDKVMSRRELYGLLAITDQIRFITALALAGVDEWTMQNVDREYSQRLKLAASVGILTVPIFFVAFGISGIAHIVTNPASSAFSFFGLAFIAATATTIAVVRKKKREEAPTPWFSLCIRAVLLTTILSACLGATELLSSTFTILTGNLNTAPNFLTAYALLWPISALCYVAIDPMPTTHRSWFPFDVIVVPLWSFLKKSEPSFLKPPIKRQVFSVSRMVIIVAVVFAVAELSSRGWRFDKLTSAEDKHLHAVSNWIAATIITACLLLPPVIDHLRDAYWLKRWKRDVLGGDDGDAFIWLSSLRTNWGSGRMIATLTKKEPSYSSIRMLSSVSELAVVLEWVKDLGLHKKSRIPSDMLATMSAVFAESVSRWIIQYDRRFPGRLHFLATSQRETVSDYAVLLNQFTMAPGNTMP